MSGAAPEGALAVCTAGLRYTDIPPDVVAAVRTAWLDTLAVGVAGSTAGISAALAACAESWGSGAEAHVWGRGTALPAVHAALVNAHQAHAQEYDPVHESALTHPMAAITASLLAEAGRPRQKLSGRAAITATVAGVEVAAVIGRGAGGPPSFYRQAMAAGFGAAAALANARGLDAATARASLAITFTQLGGTLQAHREGAEILATQMGANTRAAMTAVDLAAAGITGPEAFLTGADGYYARFEAGTGDLAAITHDIGRPWQVIRLSRKPFPTGRLTHGAVAALMALDAAGDIDCSGISEVHVSAPAQVVRLVGRPLPERPSAGYARLCLPFVAGCYLARGQVTPREFTHESLRDPAIHAAAAVVTVSADPACDDAATVPQTVTVTHTEGTQATHTITAMPGHPDNPMSADSSRAKIAAALAAGQTGPGPAELTAAIDALAETADITIIDALLAGT